MTSATDAGGRRVRSPGRIMVPNAQHQGRPTRRPLHAVVGLATSRPARGGLPTVCQWCGMGLLTGHAAAPTAASRKWSAS